MCTNAECDIIGVFADFSSPKFPLAGRWMACQHCVAEGDHRESLEALRALGKAVAIVALASVTRDASLGLPIEWHHEVKSGKTCRIIAMYWQSKRSWSITVFDRVTADAKPVVIELPEIAGDSEDVGAVVVDAVLLEAQKWISTNVSRAEEPHSAALP